MTEQFYSHYTTWEDYQNGMYDISKKDNEEELINNAKNLLCNPSLFLESMNNLIQDWHISTKVNLTNNGINKRAWLGQAACCYEYKVPEILTRIAWNNMTEEQQRLANKIAEKVINLYETKNILNAQIEIRF